MKRNARLKSITHTKELQQHDEAGVEAATAHDTDKIGKGLKIHIATVTPHEIVHGVCKVA